MKPHTVQQLSNQHHPQFPYRMSRDVKQTQQPLSIVGVWQKDAMEKQTMANSHHQLARQKLRQQLRFENLPLTINSMPVRRIHLNNFNGTNLAAMRRTRQLGIVKEAQKERFFKNQFKNNYHARHFAKEIAFNRSKLANNGSKLRPKRICARGELLRKIKEFIIDALQNSSTHGLPYLVKTGLSLIERTLWFAFICVALFSIISLSHRTWQRFQTSPMVISMDRNKLVWNTSFPSLTVCPHKRIDELKLEEYIMSHPDDIITHDDEVGFRDFIEKLAHLSYENIEQLPVNKSYGITSDKYLDVLYDLKWEFNPEISSGAVARMLAFETQTEFGICNSVNSLVARYNSYEYWKTNQWTLLNHGERVTVHPLDGEIYAQIINLSTSYDVYFHSSNDIPSITKQRYTFFETDYTTVELNALEIYTDEAAKAFSPKQRKCRFQHEAEGMLAAPIYSFGLCLAECRLFLALRVCNCVPHFYRNTLRNGRVSPICDLRGLACVAKLKREMISLKSDRYEIDCKCVPNCDDSNFFVQSYRSRAWFLGANFQWGIMEYPKMQLRRNAIFTFADVLVYIGGLAGFFLGCSFLSFVEIIYYITVRFVRKLMS